MKRYIRSSYSEPYIPDMTERFPEGLDGPDMYDYDDPEDAMWAAMEDDYYSSLEPNLNHYREMSDEEFEALSEAEKQEYYDLEDEWNEYQGTEGAQWFRR